MIDLDAIEQAARAATPGPWETGEAHPEGIPYVGARFQDEVYSQVSSPYMPRAGCEVIADAYYIALANPATVLALIARLRAAEAALSVAFNRIDLNYRTSKWVAFYTAEEVAQIRDVVAASNPPPA